MSAAAFSPARCERVGLAVRRALHELDEHRRRHFGSTADAPWTIAMRVKDAASIEKKIQRKRESGQPQYGVSHLTDVVGVRVVVESRACALHLAELVRERFTVREADCELFIDTPRADGYRGIHLILEVAPEDAPELQIPVELQIRTILQHQWSVLSHSEFYKKPVEIPPNLLLAMRSLGEVLNCAEFESEQLRRSRIQDESALAVRELLQETIEQLAQRPEASDELARLGLHLLGFDRTLRRTMVTAGDRQRRAFDALQELAKLGQFPGPHGKIATRLGEIVERVRGSLLPCGREAAQG